MRLGHNAGMKLAETPEELRAWAAMWKETGKALEEIKSKDLRMLTDEEASEIAERLLSAVTFPRAPRAGDDVCGLVEQQRLFAKVKY